MTMKNIFDTASPDPRISITEWLTNPAQPLMQYRLLYAKVGNLLFYTTARRGSTTDTVNAQDGLGKIERVIITDETDYEDNTGERLKDLQKALDKKQ